ncbi:MAG: metal-dependent hydrolase [Verrucomicrobia bacterium]|nr:metal-dependent hydrolase [Verrucomicrobiota bacterium]
MDTVTHAVVGATLGHAAFGRKLGWRAAVVGVMAGEAPDLDFLLHSDADPLFTIEYHRHFTHSLFFAPLGALAIAAPWFAPRRFRPQWRDLWLCALLNWLAHALLDACTSYGTQLLRPFHDARFGWDLISIIDPLFTLAILGGFAAALVTKRVVFARAGLGVALGYLALGGLQRARAASAQAKLAAARGHTIERRELMPTLGNHIIWRSLYQHGGNIHSDRIRVGWFSSPTVKDGTSLPLVSESQLGPAERARNGRLRSFQRFNWFSAGWVARSPADPSVIGDMRYSLSQEAFDPIWGIRFTAPDHPHEVEWVNRSRNRSLRLADLWAEVSGRHESYRKLP